MKQYNILFLRMRASLAAALLLCLVSQTLCATIPQPKTNYLQPSFNAREARASSSNLITTPLFVQSNAAPLPPGFKPGQRFIPPIFDASLDFEVVRKPAFNKNFNFDAAVARLDKPGCSPGTTTVTVQRTSVHPSTYYSVSTTSVTSFLPDIQTHYKTHFVTQTVTDREVRTYISTIYDTVVRKTTETRFVQPTTLLSTSTLTVVNYDTTLQLITHTNTLIFTSTNYVTETIVQSASTTVTVPITITNTVSQKPAIFTFTHTQTETRTVENYIPGPITYVTSAIYSTANLIATQSLNPETIAQTTTLFVPSYTTIATTSYELRTTSIWTTLASQATETATVFSTSTRTGVAISTNRFTHTVTQSHANYFTVSDPIVKIYSITQDVPTVTTRYTTYLQPTYYTTTLAGYSVTDYDMVTSTVLIQTTVTDSFRTPVVYVTKTVVENCSRN